MIENDVTSDDSQEDGPWYKKYVKMAVEKETWQKNQQKNNTLLLLF